MGYVLLLHHVTQHNPSTLPIGFEVGYSKFNTFNENNLICILSFLLMTTLSIIAFQSIDEHKVIIIICRRQSLRIEGGKSFHLSF